MRGLSLIAVAVLTSCVAVAPKQLVTARSDYEAALQGPAARYTPADLYEARKALDRANAEFQEYGDTYRTRDFAYVASRKIDIANAKARIEADRHRMAMLGAEAARLRDEQYASKQSELDRAREQLEEQRRATEANAQDAAMKAQQLDEALKARAAAEDKLAAAMKDLAAVAQVKEEQRGVVITLSGSVLFAPGQSTLLTSAQNRLDQVAATLVDEADGNMITVEGHTDSLGSASHNEQLSLMRAMAVRDYLIMKGVKANRIEAKGLGESRPLVDNGSAENRANNRRVEIVVQPKPIS